MYSVLSRARLTAQGVFMGRAAEQAGFADTVGATVAKTEATGRPVIERDLVIKRCLAGVFTMIGRDDIAVFVVSERHDPVHIIQGLLIQAYLVQDLCCVDAFN